jgi:hypothetical protein
VLDEPMWDDLAAQAEQWDRDAVTLDAADRLRVEQGSVGWLDRVRAQVGAARVVRLRHGARVAGRLTACGVDWLALAGPDGRARLVPAAAVVTLEGLGSRAVPPEALGVLARAVDLRMVLRRLSAAGDEVLITTLDGTRMRGVVTRVGRDHLDLAADEGGERCVPLAAVDEVAPG